MARVWFESAFDSPSAQAGALLSNEVKQRSTLREPAFWRIGLPATQPLFHPVMISVSTRSAHVLGVLVALVPAALHAAEPVAPQPLQKIDVPAQSAGDDKYQVQGIVQIGPAMYASLKGPLEQQARWCRLHEVFGDQVVDEITASQVVLRNRRTGRQQVLQPIAAPAEPGLTAPDPAADARQSALVPFSKAWINSKENPMLHGLQQLPIDIVMEWPALPKDQKEAIIEYYLKHGWSLIGVETVGRSSSFHWENIYGKERSAAILANRREFEASLTKEQQAAYQAIKNTPMMRVINGQITPEQEIERKRRGEASAKFNDSLSPQQRQQKENIPDFTNRLGVPDVR